MSITQINLLPVQNLIHTIKYLFTEQNEKLSKRKVLEKYFNLRQHGFMGRGTLLWGN